METRKYELIVEGLRMIKEGALFVIIGSLIISIVSVALVFTIPFSTFLTQHPAQQPPIPHIIG
ncbi:MAG: hypothetical protein DRO16_02870, partial [Thermoprotei archaeon]